MSRSDPGSRRHRPNTRTSVINERIHHLNKSRGGLIANLTKLINRISLQMAVKDSNSSEINDCMTSIKNTFNKIAQTTEQYVEIVDPNEKLRAETLFAEIKIKFEQVQTMYQEYLKSIDILQTPSRRETRSVSERISVKSENSKSSKHSRNSHSQ